MLGRVGAAARNVTLPKAVPMEAAALPESLGGFVRRVSLPHQVAISIMSVAVFLLSTAPLEVQRRIVNDALGHGTFGDIARLCAAYAGLALLEGLIKFAMNVYRGWIGEVAVLTLRETIGALAEDGRGSATPEETGVESAMIIAEADPIGSFVGVFLSEPLLQGGVLASVFGYMLYLQPWMAMVAFVVFSPQLVFVPLMQRAINRRVAVRVRVLRRVSVAIAAVPTGHAADSAAQNRRVSVVFQLNMAIYTLKFSMNFFMNLLHHLGTAGVLAAGGYLVLAGRTEVGVVVAFISGLAKINDPWGDLVNWFRDLTVTSTKYRLIAQAVRGFADRRWT